MKKLVFLHGWAQSQQIWFQQRQAFPKAQFLNLPGHGGASDISSEQWTAYLHSQLPDEPCVLVGWSLGGMLALDIAAQFPQSITALALVSTTPCFRLQHDWPAGCDATLFSAFEDAVSSQSARLLNRFFALMLHGDDINRRDYNQVAKQAVDRNHPTTPQGLQDGLDLLATLDNRLHISSLQMPTLVMHGQEDAIVSAASSDWLAEHISHAQHIPFQACGHAPFLSQPETFNTILHHWWNTL